MTSASNRAPLTDTIIIAVSKLVDDSKLETREPSHSDIEFQINRFGLKDGDPKQHGQIAGKAKRIRATLIWALDQNHEAGEQFIFAIISVIKGCGGFISTSQNYVGQDEITSSIRAFRTEGYELTIDGELFPIILDNLSGTELTAALEAYIRRAKRGVTDAALVTGTGKDLLEATAAHILIERNRWSNSSSGANFQALLGQTFVALGLATPQDTFQIGESSQRNIERKMFELACEINRLRNKQGTGHGHPWLPTVTQTEANNATEIMGTIAEYLLNCHKGKP